MQGKSVPSIKGLVFDNPNSSTVRYINALAGVKAIPEKGVFSFKTNDEVIKYVSENDGMIGVVGVNWLSQPMPAMQKYVDNVNVLSVKGSTSASAFYPSQNNIAEGKYPLARDLYIINCQGYSGLGMGFASFVAGDIGQRIILKSGLLPVRIPGRNITIRNKIIMIRNKLTTIKMNKFKIFSVALLASVTASQAQDLNQAKKAIDAEQFESAKSILKSIINTKPSNGRAHFF